VNQPELHGWAWDWRGQAGFAADIIVLDRDFLAQGRASLLKATVQLTMMN